MISVFVVSSYLITIWIFIYLFELKSIYLKANFIHCSLLYTSFCFIFILFTLIKHSFFSSISPVIHNITVIVCFLFVLFLSSSFPHVATYKIDLCTDSYFDHIHSLAFAFRLCEGMMEELINGGDIQGIPQNYIRK